MGMAHRLFGKSFPSCQKILIYMKTKMIKLQKVYDIAINDDDDVLLLLLFLFMSISDIFVW